MRHITKRSAMGAIVAAAGLTAAIVPGSALGRGSAAAKPSLKITGISVNMQYETPGTKVTLKNPVNACYYIGGADQTPQSVTMVAYVHAVRVPANAPLTETVTAPWGSFTAPSTTQPAKHFGDLWFNHGGVKALFGGPTGPDDWFMHYSPYAGDDVFNGYYAVKMAVKVDGKTLQSSATLNIDCS